MPSTTSAALPAAQAWHRPAPAAHRRGVNTATASTGLPQYPAVEARLRSLAAEVISGEREEDEARNLAFEAVYASGLVGTTVRYWLSGWGSKQMHLLDDLLFEAESWIMRAITGHAVGEHMIDNGKPTATLMNFERIHAGASGVGYLRKGLLTEMGKFMRTVRRHSSLGPNHHLMDATLLGVGAAATDDDAISSLDRYVLDQVQSRGNDNVAEPEHAEVAHSLYVERSRNAGAGERARARDEALRTFYRVPPARRPVEPAERRELLDIVKNDPAAAYASMLAVLRDEPAAGLVEKLTILWVDYDEADLESILASPRSEQAAHTLAVAALAPWPRLRRDVARRLRVSLSRRFKEAGRSSQEGAAIAEAYVRGEHEAGSSLLTNAALAREWTDLAADVIDSAPHLLGSDLVQFRARLSEMVDELIEPRRPSVAAA